MEFWGIEIKSGETLPVKMPDEGKILHLSQACVGQTKKMGNDLIYLHAKKGGKKYLIGVLSYDKFPFLNFDLVFEDDFELFHDSKYGSVHLAGYVTDIPVNCYLTDDTVESDEESDEDVTIPISAKDNGSSGKPGGKQAKADEKFATGASKDKVKIVEPNKDAKKSEQDDDSDEDSDEDGDEDEEMDNAESDSEENEDDSSDGDEEDSDEETPKKVEVSKKRPAEASVKTPASDKKAKFVTPQKIDGKKAHPVHVATPYPKQAGKTTSNSDKSKPQTPKSTSGGAFSCITCNRRFGSDGALQAHTNAKHNGAK